MPTLERPTECRQGSLTPEQVAFYQREGYLALPHLLSQEDMAPAREAMTQKVSEIADALFAAGMIADKREDFPFETRLARLFDGLSDKDFLEFGRSWRDRLPGYFVLMSNPKILDAVPKPDRAGTVRQSRLQRAPQSAQSRGRRGSLASRQIVLAGRQCQSRHHRLDPAGGFHPGERLPAPDPAHTHQARPVLPQRDLFRHGVR